VQALLGNEPRRRDLLIEHLHKIQDAADICSDAHLVGARRRNEHGHDRVYEVAALIHHFGIVKDGAAAPAAITVRVCDAVSCEKWPGAQQLLEKLPRILGKNVRVIPCPCVWRRCEPRRWPGRPESAPACDWPSGVAKLVAARAVQATARRNIDYREYRKQGRATDPAGMPAPASANPAAHKAINGDSGLRGLGGAGFPAGRKWKIVRAEPEPRCWR